MPPSAEARPATVADAARAARRAAGALARLRPEVRDGALEAMARSLAAAQDHILAANAGDLRAARPLVDAGRMSEALFARLDLGAAKLAGVVEGVRQVAALEDPLGRVTLSTELDDGLCLSRVTCPIGVVGVVFEARPDALPQIVALCLKSGNAVLLKGGSEAERTNRALFDVIRAATEAAGIPAGALALLEGRDEVAALLQAEPDVDLIVPRGSGALVRWVQDHTRIPVLGHAEGVCHVYVDRAADLEKAVAIAVDAKVQYPAACNAAETLLVHAEVAGAFLPGAIRALADRGVELRCDARAAAACAVPEVRAATERDWGVEFGDLVLAVRVVDTLEDAIAHIGRYGSRHTEAIVTEDPAAWERFFAEVDAAGVYLNASTRFADGFRYGFGAEVGVSTGKLHPRGPVGLDGLVTYKYRLVGAGHVVATYAGPGGRRFRHARGDA